MAYVLDVESLLVCFGKTTVLRGLTFGVEEGTSLAIIGPNGSGKTILFKALVGSLQGQIRWAPGVRIGYVPQKLDLERDLPITGLDLLHAKANVAGSDEDIVDVFRGVGLGDEVAKPIEEGDIRSAGISVVLDDELRALRAARIDALDRALDAIGRGRFGGCARCGAPIEIARLEEAPDTAVCTPCAREALGEGR